MEFEKWDKEIKNREEAGGGGNSGGGGWFGWGGRFGGSNGDHFWQEAQQASLTILGILATVSTCASSSSVTFIWIFFLVAPFGILFLHLSVHLQYLIVAKGDVLLAVIFNPLLFALRGTRTGFTFLTSKITNRVYGRYHTDVPTIPQQEVTAGVSAKERVVGKWGSE